MKRVGQRLTQLEQKMFFTDDNGIITHYFEETSYIDLELSGCVGIHGLIHEWKKGESNIAPEQIIDTVYSVIGKMPGPRTIRKDIMVAFNEKGDWFVTEKVFTENGYDTLTMDHEYTDEQIGIAVYRALLVNAQDKYVLANPSPQKTIKVDFSRRGKIKPPA